MFGKRRAHSLEESLDSVFWRARVWGVLFHSAREGRPEVRWALYNGLVWGHYLLMSRVLWRYTFWKHGGSALRLFLWIIYAGLAHIGYIANTVCVLRQRRHFRLFLHYLRTSDRLLTSAGRPVDYPTGRFAFYLVMTITTAGYWLFYKQPVWNSSTIIVFHIFWMQLIHLQARAETFYILTRLVARPMSQLTDLLQDAGLDLDRLLLLSRIHSALCSSATAIGKLFTLQNLICVGVIFYSVVCNTENMVLAYKYQNMDFALNKIYFSSWFLVIFYKMVQGPAHLIEKANEFNTVLYRLMMDDKTGTLVGNKKLRLHIQMKQDIIITAGGFFNLDYPLLHSIFASATAYLVILVEFGQDDLPTTPISPIANLSLSN